MNWKENAVRRFTKASIANIATGKQTFIAVVGVMLLMAIAAVLTSNVNAQKPGRLIERDQDEKPAPVKPTPTVVPTDNTIAVQSITIDAFTSQDKSFDIPSNRIDSLITNQASDRAAQEIIRVFSGGMLIENPALAFGLVRKAGRYSPESRSLVVTGSLNGDEVLEDIRFLELDETSLLIVRDIYLDGLTADPSVGRGLPFQIDQIHTSVHETVSLGSFSSKEASRDNYGVAASVSQPTLSSISGVSNWDAGITNGKVDMTCGNRFNGHYAINDKTGSYRLTLRGNNFGSTRGSVKLAGANVPIVNWSNTSILIDPTVSPYSSPLCAVLKITTASGAVLNYGLNIVPAIRTRIFGQCTHHVALTRLQMGLQPSPTAYGNYASITPSYVPRVGDQYQWSAGGGKHTGIVTRVAGPVSSTGGTKTWTLTIGEQNADCRNTINSYTTQFQTKTTGNTTTVATYPRASYGSYTCKLYWR